MNASPQPEQRRSRAGAIALLVVGSVAALLALAVLAAGGAALWQEHTKRDAAGYFTSASHRFAAGSYALTHEGVDLGDLPNVFDHGKLAHVRIRATSQDGRPLFVGIARERAVSAYLAGVAHAEVGDVDLDPFVATYHRVGGTAEPARPASKRFWAASSTGTHPSVTWPVAKGSWSVVVMNADGSPAVAADVDVGAKVKYVDWVVGGALGFGAVLLGLGALLIALGGRRMGGPGAPATASDGPAVLAGS